MHPQFEYQRAVQARRPRYTQNRTATRDGVTIGIPYTAFEPGAACVHPRPAAADAPGSRPEQRSEDRRLRGIAKAEASMTSRQRRLRDQRASRAIAQVRLEKEVGGNAQLHPENPYVPRQLRKKLREEKGRAARIALITKGLGERLAKAGKTVSGIILPTKTA